MSLPNFLADESAQGILEYALILMLVAMVAFSALQALGQKPVFHRAFNGAANALS